MTGETINGLRALLSATEQAARDLLVAKDVIIKEQELRIASLEHRMAELERYLPHLRQAGAGDISPVPMRMFDGKSFEHIATQADGSTWYIESRPDGR